MADVKIEIPEWTGSTLTVGAFTNYANSVLAAFKRQTFSALALDSIGRELEEAVNRLSEFVNRPSAFDETPEIAKADSNRDALWKILWHAWNYAMQLDPEHALYKAALTLKSEVSAYKGVWTHELSKETTELKGLQRDLNTDANAAALATLGLDKITAALFAANDAVAAAIERREQSRGERIAEKGGDTTASLRKAVVSHLIDAYRQVNGAARIIIGPEQIQAVQDVCGIIEHYKHVAAQPASRQGKVDPEPGPAPEPDGEAAAS